jgi:DNA-binding CsgD family transcriptional regulator
MATDPDLGTADDRPAHDLMPVLLSLVGQLVRTVAEGGASSSENPSRQGDPLLDVEVDGVRCRCWRVMRTAAPATMLSPREREVVRMVGQGCTNQAVADSLGISQWTVSTHLRRIFAKLQVNSRAAMVARELEAGAEPR